MKKALAHTRVMVKLRKSEIRDEWFLYVESYPVFEQGSDKPKREREYLNRSVTTPIWDKSRVARTAADGSVTYKPKRDPNGIILCKSTLDQEACIFADKVRNLRQHEYDNAALYTDKDAEMAEQNAKGRQDFIPYIKEVSDKRHRNSSDAIRVNWRRVKKLVELYTGGEPLPFNKIDLSLIEDFKYWILDAPQGGGKSGTISQNTASTYFGIFKAALHQGFVDGFLSIDLSAKVHGIESVESRREYLTIDELNVLVDTPCDNDILKRAALFSALTSLRHCDIQSLHWGEIVEENGRYRINFTQNKTKGVEYQPISEQAYWLCGERRDSDRLVFEGLQAPSWINVPLKRWIESSGITKHITFHCFRHSFATNQLAEGTDLFTISKMMGHTNIKTTQIYTKVVDEKKNVAADAIKLNIDKK